MSQSKEYEVFQQKLLLADLESLLKQAKEKISIYHISQSKVGGNTKGKDGGNTKGKVGGKIEVSRTFVNRWALMSRYYPLGGEPIENSEKIGKIAKEYIPDLKECLKAVKKGGSIEEASLKTTANYNNYGLFLTANNAAFDPDPEKREKMEKELEKSLGDRLMEYNEWAKKQEKEEKLPVNNQGCFPVIWGKKVAEREVMKRSSSGQLQVSM